MLISDFIFLIFWGKKGGFSKLFCSGRIGFWYQIIEDLVLDSLRKMAKKYLDENNLESILKNSDKL